MPVRRQLESVCGVGGSEVAQQRIEQLGRASGLVAAGGARKVRMETRVAEFEMK